MNEDVKPLILRALRSGEYKQGQGALRSADDGILRHCCLGVICELYKIHVDPTIEWDDRSRPGERAHRFLGHSSYLPVEVEAWAGLDYEAQKKMSVWNDADDWCDDDQEINGFAEIADKLERNDQEARNEQDG